MTTKTQNQKLVSKKANQSVLAEYSQEQLEIIKSHIAKGASNQELAYFLTVCKNQNLDPFSRQIYFVKRKVKQPNGAYADQMTIQIGIDGYRAIAEQTGSLAGIDDPVYDVENAPHPNKATVTVYRFVKGKKVAFTATARWAEYCPQDQRMAFMWRRMPYHMLGKVAEALALRKAFPRRLGGIYTEEEMHSAENEPVAVSNADELKPQEPDSITDEQISKIKALLVKKGKEEKKMLAHYRKNSITDFTYKEAQTIITMLEAAPDNPLVTDDGQVVEAEIVEEMPPTPPKKVKKQIIPDKPDSPVAAKIKAGLEKHYKEREGVTAEVAHIYQRINAKKRKTAEEKQFIADIDAGKFKGEEAYPTIFKKQ